MAIYSIISTLYTRKCIFYFTEYKYCSIKNVKSSKNSTENSIKSSFYTILFPFYT